MQHHKTKTPRLAERPGPCADPVPWDSPGAQEIGFEVPERYNASEVLFQNLAPDRAHRLALTGPAGERTYAEVCAEAARWGHGLLSFGATRGERILFLCDDTPAYPAAFFGAVRAGLVPVMLNVLTPADQLQFCLSDAGARFAVCDAAFGARFAGVQGLERLIVVGGIGDLPAPGVRAEALLAGRPGTLAAADTHRCDMALMMYSSGSTGKPKGIVHLQHDMAYTHRSYGSNVLRLKPDDRCFSTAKIFFSYGFGNSITFPFSVGATVVLMPGRPTPETVLETIARYRPSVFFGVPTLYSSMLRAPEFEHTDFSSLRFAVSAAEALSPEMSDEWMARTGVEMIDCLGATELLNVYISNSLDAKRRGSVGRRVPGYEIALKDEHGRDVPDGREGALWLRGHSSTPMYWNRPKRTAETVRPDGWIVTRDRYVRDPDGFYFYRGRADDLVKVSGQWVHPLEVQHCLNAHPSVRECSVLATEGKEGRMRLTAFVVREEKAPAVTARMLQDYVKRTLLPHKYPRVVRFVPALPKTGTGKVDRQALLQAHARRAAQRERPAAP